MNFLMKVKCWPIFLELYTFKIKFYKKISKVLRHAMSQADFKTVFYTKTIHLYSSESRYFIMKYLDETVQHPLCEIMVGFY